MNILWKRIYLKVMHFIMWFVAIPVGLFLQQMFGGLFIEIDLIVVLILLVLFNITPSLIMVLLMGVMKDVLSVGYIGLSVFIYSFNLLVFEWVMERVSLNSYVQFMTLFSVMTMFVSIIRWVVECIVGNRFIFYDVNFLYGWLITVGVCAVVLFVLSRRSIDMYGRSRLRMKTV